MCTSGWGAVYRMYDQTRKRQIQAAQLEARLAEAQLDVLRMQLQPHFLFNTLQAALMLVFHTFTQERSLVMMLVHGDQDAFVNQFSEA